MDDNYIKARMLSDLEVFTRVIFRSQYHREFEVSDHHREIIAALHRVLDGKCNRLIINMPPRYGKTELVVKMFVAMAFAINPKSKFLHLSYSDLLVKNNSEAIQDALQQPLYQRLFPGAALTSRKPSKTYWKTVSGGEFYAAPTNGQITGFGAGQFDVEELPDFSDFTDTLSELPQTSASQVFSGGIIIDDPVKPEDAMSDLIRDKINNRFETTIRNRVNSRHTPIVIIMQRLHERDLSGYLMEEEPGTWEVLSLPAITSDIDTGEECALWPRKHSLEELHKLRELDPFIFDTQYLQNPKPREGLLYPDGLQVYHSLPTEAGVWKNYTDTADRGKDYLCSICYVETRSGCYVTDILYTQKGMEFTENETARMLTRNRTDKARIESNNGGRGFARNVADRLRESGNLYTRVITFTQSKNKESRIITNSASVYNTVYMPHDWQQRWPQFAKHVLGFRKDGGNMFDDAPDTLTGIVEDFDALKRVKGITKLN